MPSEAAKKRKEKKKTQNQARLTAAKTTSEAVNGVVNGITNGVSSAKGSPNGSLAGDISKLKVSNISVTGVLLSHPESRDLHLGAISLRYHGAELLTDAKVEMNCGRRYGLLGPNGCGKFIKYTHFKMFCLVSWGTLQE